MKKQLQEAKDLAFKNATAIVELAKTENRSMTEDEMAEVRAFHTEIDSTTAQLEVIAKQEQFRAASSLPVTHAMQTQSKEEVDIRQEYSFKKAILATMPNGMGLSGVEKEMHEEALIEARSAGIEMSAGGIHIPEIMLRANAVAPDTAGGHTVNTTIVAVDAMYRNYTALERNGTTFLRNLQGNIKFSRQDALAYSTWKPEVADSDEAAITFDGTVMTPKRLAVHNYISMQLLAQSSIDIESFIRMDLIRSTMEEVERVALNGSGTGDIPLGLLNAAGIPTISMGDPDGGAVTYDKLVDMESEVANNNAQGNMNFLVNSRTRGGLRKDRIDPGSGKITWAGSNLDSTLIGYDAYVSNNVPSDLTKGGGTNLSAAVFGNFNDLIIGQWGGLSLITDPYSKAVAGQINLVLNSFWDVHVKRTASFSKAIDIITG